MIIMVSNKENTKQNPNTRWIPCLTKTAPTSGQTINHSPNNAQRIPKFFFLSALSTAMSESIAW